MYPLPAQTFYSVSYFSGGTTVHLCIIAESWESSSGLSLLLPIKSYCSASCFSPLNSPLSPTATTLVQALIIFCLNHCTFLQSPLFFVLLKIMSQVNCLVETLCPSHTFCPPHYLIDSCVTRLTAASSLNVPASRTEPTYSGHLINNS